MVDRQALEAALEQVARGELGRRSSECEGSTRRTAIVAAWRRPRLNSSFTWLMRSRRSHWSKRSGSRRLGRSRQQATSVSWTASSARIGSRRMRRARRRAGRPTLDVMTSNASRSPWAARSTSARSIATSVRATVVAALTPYCLHPVRKGSPGHEVDPGGPPGSCWPRRRSARLTQHEVRGSRNGQWGTDRAAALPAAALGSVLRRPSTPRDVIDPTMASSSAWKAGSATMPGSVRMSSRFHRPRPGSAAGWSRHPHQHCRTRQKRPPDQPAAVVSMAFCSVRAFAGKPPTVRPRSDAGETLDLPRSPQEFGDSGARGRGGCDAPTTRVGVDTPWTWNSMSPLPSL